jgi:hypothetical protein
MTLLQFFDGFYTLILFCRSLLLPVVDPPTYYYADDHSNSNTEICTRCVCHINTILCYFRQTSPDCKNLKYRNTIMPNLNVICAHLRFKRHVLGLLSMILSFFCCTNLIASVTVTLVFSQVVSFGSIKSDVAST